MLYATNKIRAYETDTTNNVEAGKSHIQGSKDRTNIKQGSGGVRTH